MELNDRIHISGRIKLFLRNVNEKFNALYNSSKLYLLKP